MSGATDHIDWAAVQARNEATTDPTIKAAVRAGTLKLPKPGELIRDWAHTHVRIADPLERAQSYSDKVRIVGLAEPAAQPIVDAAIAAAELEKAAGDAAGPPPAEHLTDLGNTERFARQHVGRVLYAHPLGYRVYHAPTGVWRSDRAGLMQLAKKTVRSWDATAAATEGDAKRQAIRKHAIASESTRALKAMLELASSEPALQAEPRDFDADPMLLNAPNGVVDLQTGELLPHAPGMRLTKVTGAPYVPDAPYPQWQAHLERVFAGDAGLIDFVQRLFGYGLTGLTIEQVLSIFYGTGANGKTVTVETTAAALGDYAAAADFRSFMVTRSEGPRNDLARLAGARMVTASEGMDGSRLDEALVKQVTGGEPLTVRFLHQEHFEYVPQFKLILSSNHKPEVRGTDHGIRRRMCMVPFTVTIPEPEQDFQLQEKLRDELPGILAWMVRGCLSWQERGLAAPAAVQAATSGYLAEMDVLATFLGECTTIDPQAAIPALYVYRAYQSWAKRSGEHEMSQRRFTAALREHSVSVDGRESGTGRQLCWGIRLAKLTDEDEQ